MSEGGHDNDDKNPDPAPAPVEMPKQRFITGVCVWVTGQLSPLLIPFIVSSGLSDSLKATLSAVLFFGFPPLFTFAAIIILGKEGFNYLRARIAGFFRRQVLPAKVSRGRYYVGLVLFTIPILCGWILPYLEPLYPGLARSQIAIALALDGVLLLSLLVLGGDFWEKLRGLFIYDSQPEPVSPA